MKKGNNKKRPNSSTRKRTYSKPKAKTKRRMSGFSPAVVSGPKKRRKKRKVKGLTGNPILDAVLGLGIGTAAAMALTKFIPMENKKARDGIIAALGVAALMFGAKQNDRLVQGVGSGLLVVGGTQLAQDFGVMQGLTGFMNGMGVTEDEDVMFIEMQGVPQQDVMGRLQEMMNGPNQIVPVISGNNYGTENMGNDMPSVVSNTVPRNNSRQW